MYVSLDENRRILVTSDIKEYLVNPIKYDFPDWFNFSDQDNYIITEDGKLVRSEKEPTKEEIVSSNFKYLEDTDYIIAKYYESSLTGEDISESDKKRYDDIIEKRKLCRQQLNLMGIDNYSPVGAVYEN